jgi:eukaryotic-like serine/threonine-protein kinase
MSFLRALQTSSRYRLDDKIGTGGYGEVWRATDVLLGRPVAVKQLPPNRARSEQTLIRFRAEAQRAGSLGHGNITRVYDYVEPAPPDPPFLVMELVDGPSAAQVLACGALHPAQAMSLVAEAAAGLQAAHEAGFVHRDIKPANLLLTGDGQVKVTDFGVSYAINSLPMTSSNTLLGTPGYVAPERLTGGGVTAAADLYALGIVAWECLTGRPPFRGMPIEVVVAHRDQPLPPLPASVPAEVAALVAELTAKDPADRPDSAGEVARRAAGLRDRLAREAGVSACPLAGPWSRAGHDGPSGPVGVSTVPSSEVDLFKRAFGQPSPSISREQPPVPPVPPEPPASPEPPPARGRPRWLRLALGAVAAALVATGVTVTQLTGAGTLAHQPPGSARQRSPGASATPGTGGHHTGTSPAGRPTTGAAGGPGAGTAPQASTRPVGTAPAVSGSRPATTASASPTPSPTSSTGNGKGKAKGKGKGNGNGNGHGNG